MSIFLLNCIEVSKEKKCVNPLDFNFPESHILLQYSRSYLPLFLSYMCLNKKQSTIVFLYDFGKIIVKKEKRGKHALKQIQHIIKIYRFSDMNLIFWLNHIIKQEFQHQCTAKSPSFNFEIRKSHRQIAVLDILYPDKS